MVRQYIGRYGDFVRSWSHCDRETSNAQGPVAGFTNAASAFQLDVQLEQGELTLEHINGLTTLLREQSKGHFNFVIKEAIQHHVLLVLQLRTTNGAKGDPGFRKDMVGITTDFDKHATMANLRYTQKKVKPDNKNNKLQVV